MGLGASLLARVALTRVLESEVRNMVDGGEGERERTLGTGFAEPSGQVICRPWNAAPLLQSGHVERGDT